jgi:predicted metal-dependent enzyme (double-stranded beta helix superfamily)
VKDIERLYKEYKDMLDVLSKKEDNALRLNSINMLNKLTADLLGKIADYMEDKAPEKDFERVTMIVDELKIISASRQKGRKKFFIIPQTDTRH